MKVRFFSLACLLAGFAPVSAQPFAPPPAIPGIVRPAPERGALPAGLTGQYSIGEPTAEEQLYLELVNRTRADPAAEANRLANTTDPAILAAYKLFAVDLVKFQADVAAIAPTPPLAFEPRLINSARGHTLWMKTFGIQAHDETDPPGSANVVNSLGDRVSAAGYLLTAAGESIFAYAESPEQGHAGFEVDWGFGPGGVQDPPGHRISNHSASYREIGVGVLDGDGPNNTGPQFVTYDFGNRADLPPLITGVTYYDINGNQFYDIDEGLGAVTVNVSGSDSFAVTSASGGYAVPSTDGARTVTFTVPGAAAVSKNVTVSGGQNVKVDLALPYPAPPVTGPALAFVGAPNAYSFPAVPGATGYEWQQASRAAFTATEGAENDLANVTATVSEEYSPITTTVKRSGAKGFRLLHPTPADAAQRPPDQVLLLNTRFRANAASQIKFATRVGFATTGQTARAQVSVDEARSWQTIWSQTGLTPPGSNGVPGEFSFTLRTTSLASFAGKEVRVRFTWSTTGQYFPQTDNDNVGFYLDDISFTDTDALSGITTNAVPSGTGFSFTPPVAGKYAVNVHPKVGKVDLPSGPWLLVDTTNGIPPPVHLTLTASGPGTVGASPGGGSYPPGTVVTLTATPSANAMFTGWSGGASGTVNPLQLTVNADTSVTANFQLAAEVRVTVGGITLGPGGNLRLDFQLTSGAPTSFSLERADTLTSPWLNLGATLVTNSPGNFTYKQIVPTGVAGFLRVRAQ
jgi:hypothetical protein